MAHMRYTVASVENAEGKPVWHVLDYGVVICTASGYPTREEAERNRDAMEKLSQVADDAYRLPHARV